MVELTANAPGDVGAPSPRRRLQPDQRRNELLDVASDIVSEQGQGALTLQRLAATAGVSNGLVYRYFTNRADVLLALLEAHWSVLDEELSRTGSGAESFEDLVRSWSRAYLDAIRRRGPAFRRLNYEPSVEPLVEQRRRVRRMQFLEVFAANYRGHLGLTSDEARTAAVMLLGAIEAAAEQMVSMRLDAEMVEDIQVALVMDGLTRLRRRHGEP